MNRINESIEMFIPQRDPFVMIDQLVAHDEKKTQSIFLVKKGNIFVENDRFTEPGLIENIAQTAAARAGYVSALENKPVSVGYIGAIKNLAIYSLPFVEDTLETEITVSNQVFNITVISGKVRCNAALLAECEMKIFIQS